MIACGRLHCLFIDPEDLVWAYGGNEKGQLGIGTLQDQEEFCQIQGIPSAVQVSAAMDGFHSAILDHQGNLYMFGQNKKSQTGCDEEQTKIASPTKVRDLPSIIMVSCGFDHTIALDATGCLWGVGDNSYGQLSSEGAILKKFTQITNNTTELMGKVTKISCGFQSSICQSETGELWSVGYNNCGELGLGHNENVNLFQKVLLEDDILVQNFHCGIRFSVVLDRDGAVWTSGHGPYNQFGSDNREDNNKLTKMLNIPPMAHIVCVGWGVIMTDRNGKMYANCRNNQVKTPVFSPKVVPAPPRIIQGCLGYNFSLVVDEEGGVWTSYRYVSESGKKKYYITEKYVLLEELRANTMNEMRFFKTKRAHQ